FSIMKDQLLLTNKNNIFIYFLCQLTCFLVCQLMSLTEECAKVTGIPFLTECYLEEAMAVLNS
ncbi:MAG: hypothetical protein WBH05_09635, partial [Syntrophobacteria bacterium]